MPAGYDLNQLVEYKDPNHWHRRATTRNDTRPWSSTTYGNNRILSYTYTIFKLNWIDHIEQIIHILFSKQSWPHSNALINFLSPTIPKQLKQLSDVRRRHIANVAENWNAISLPLEMIEWGTMLEHEYCTRFPIRDYSGWVCRVTFRLDWFFRKLTRQCSGYGHVSARLAPISSRNDFIVLPIKLSPAKTVPDFDFGRHSINFQRNYTYTKEQHSNN